MCMCSVQTRAAFGFIWGHFNKERRQLLTFATGLALVSCQCLFLLVAVFPLSCPFELIMCGPVGRCTLLESCSRGVL